MGGIRRSNKAEKCAGPWLPDPLPDHGKSRNGLTIRSDRESSGEKWYWSFPAYLANLTYLNGMTVLRFIAHGLALYVSRLTLRRV